jgi:D-3-phosphoglycerate dehydrogenase
MRCLIIDDVHPVLIQILETAGIQVLYQPDIKADEIKNNLKGVDILVIRSKIRIEFPFLSHAPDLRIIARAGAGLDIVDLDYVKANGIEVLHAGEGNADAVGEHTIGLILGLLSKIAAADRSVKNFEWNREGFRGTEIKGKTVGLIGYGNMGRAVASRLKSFSCQVICYDKYLESMPDNNAVPVSLEKLMELSDIISLHIPLTVETKAWINADFIKKCKKGLFLINTSRGEILPFEGLIGLLHDGNLAGLALDVFENEPPSKKNQNTFSVFSELIRRENVILTPHVAGWSLESYEKISKVLGDKIIRCFSLTEN